MFKYDLFVQDKKNLTIESQGDVILYNTDDRLSLSEDINNDTGIPLNITLVFDTNNINGSKQGVYLTNNLIKNNKRTINIGFENVLKCFSYFSARKLVPFNWKNGYSEYLVPNKNDENYNQFTNDSIVHTLFNSQNCIITKSNIKNEFFWMSREEMSELANNNNYDEMYQDARAEDDRYVYKLLFGEQNIYNQLSPDAKLVLDKATELVRKSIRQRIIFANNENHLNSWDAGYAQLKLLWKEYFSEEFKEFRELYKNLEDRMRPLVYELGFLLK